MTTLKTLFVITVSTVRFFLPGSPAAMNLPEGAKQPGVKSVNVEVVSNMEAETGAKAAVSLPDGFKIASPVDMMFDNNVVKAAAVIPGKKAKTLEYWGSGRGITGDQPRVILPDAKQPVDQMLQSLPHQSYAYWPTELTKPLDKNAVILGTYDIKTNYCGGASVTLGKDQDYLDPIDITDADKEADLSKPIVVRWRPVANTVGYILKAYGGNETQTITWTSSPDLDAAQGIEFRALSKDEVDRYIKTGVLMPSYIASCTIPAGIFKGASSMVIVLTAVGKDLIQTNGDTETRVIVRSTATAPLHSSPFVARRTTKTDKSDKAK